MLSRSGRIRAFRITCSRVAPPGWRHNAAIDAIRRGKFLEQNAGALVAELTRMNSISIEHDGQRLLAKIRTSERQVR